MSYYERLQKAMAMDWFEKNTYQHELKYVHNAFDGDVLKVKILVKEFKTEEPGNRSNHPPAKPGAFKCEPLKAAVIPK